MCTTCLLQQHPDRHQQRPALQPHRRCTDQYQISVYSSAVLLFNWHVFMCSSRIRSAVCSTDSKNSKRCWRADWLSAQWRIYCGTAGMFIHKQCDWPLEMCIFIQANCIGANMGGTSVFVKWHSKVLKEIISNNKIMLQIIFNQIHKKICYM